MSSSAAMIGRTGELARLLGPLAALGRGQAGAVAVIGEAGIGKTRLIDEALDRADSERVTVVRGRAADFEQLMPFGLMVDALDPFLAALEPRQLEQLGDERQAELAAVFPSIPRPGPAPVGAEVERYRAHYALRALLEQRAREQPIVLALDDVHWADEASTELLAHFLRRRFDAPILLMMAYRPHAGPLLLAKAVESATRDHRLELIELGPLSVDEANLMLGGEVDTGVRELLFRDSGGNPFYLRQLARVPVNDSNGASLPIGGETMRKLAVPQAVQASIAQEIDELSVAARSLLQGAAVAGEPFEPDVAAEIAQLDEHDAFDALDELVAFDLVHGTETPRQFLFRHPIVSRAVYESTGEGWRLAAHQRAVEALTARGEPTAVIAHHVERSARVGDRHAIELLAKAGESAAAQAPAIAARWFRAALRLQTSDDAGDDLRFDLLVALASAQASSGHLAESISALSEALGLLPSEAAARRARVVSLMAQNEAFLGRHGEARTLLADALAMTGENGTSERGRLLLDMAEDHLRTRERDAARRWGCEALQAARDARDPTVECAAAALLALVEQGRGAIPDAHRYVAQAGELVNRLPNRDLAGVLSCVFHLALAEAGLGRHPAAIALCDRGLAVSRATGRTVAIVPLTFAATWAKLALGRLDEAAEAAESMLDAARLMRIDQYVAMASSMYAWVAIQRGDLAAAVDAAEQAVVASEAAPRGLLSHFSDAVLGEAHIASGQPARGRDDILERCGGPDLTHIEASFRARWYELLAEAELALDEPERANDWIVRGEHTVERSEIPERRAAARRGRAQVLLAGGRASEAEAAAEEAVGLYVGGGLRVEAARAQLLVGQARAATGRTEAALDVLETAHQELDACGAGRARDQAARELRRLAHRVPRRFQRSARGGNGVAALTPREREVADLVAQGRTNKDVAGALFLSERTVENHLSHIFQKLDVSSRVDVARVITRSPDPES